MRYKDPEHEKAKNREQYARLLVVAKEYASLSGSHFNSDLAGWPKVDGEWVYYKWSEYDDESEDRRIYDLKFPLRYLWEEGWQKTVEWNQPFTQTQKEEQEDDPFNSSNDGPVWESVQTTENNGGSRRFSLILKVGVGIAVGLFVLALGENWDQNRVNAQYRGSQQAFSPPTHTYPQRGSNGASPTRSASYTSQAHSYTGFITIGMYDVETTITFDPSGVYFWQNKSSGQVIGSGTSRYRFEGERIVFFDIDPNGNPIPDTINTMSRLGQEGRILWFWMKVTRKRYPLVRVY